MTYTNHNGVASVAIAHHPRRAGKGARVRLARARVDLATAERLHRDAAAYAARTGNAADVQRAIAAFKLLTLARGLFHTARLEAIKAGVA